MLRRRVSLLPRELAFLVLLGLGAGGCNQSPSANEALKKSLEVNSRTQLSVARFAGTVTIDGQTPTIDRRNPLFVMVYDPKNPPKGRQGPYTTRCDKEGHFDFNTYGTGDGLPEGSYVVLFAQPKVGGADGLKNLYNDPDKNAKEPQFQIELAAPGKTNWTFELSVAGKDPNTTPGEHAVMADRGKKKQG
jgi:hypothetical protein